VWARKIVVDLSSLQFLLEVVQHDAFMHAKEFIARWTIGRLDEPVLRRSELSGMCAGHILRNNDHGYAGEEETHSRLLGVNISDDAARAFELTSGRQDEFPS
jgi:hypothetical protein